MPFAEATAICWVPRDSWWGLPGDFGESRVSGINTPTQSGKSRGNIEALVKPVIPRGGTWKVEPDCWDAILDTICSYPPDWVCFPEWEWGDMCLAVLRSKKATGIARWGCCCLQWLHITAIPFLHLRGHSTLSVTTPSSVTTSQMGILLWKGLSCTNKWRSSCW
jgi:hypothetical protein